MSGIIQVQPTMPVGVGKLLDAATAVVTGAAFRRTGPRAGYQATITGSLTVSATVEIDGSNDGQNWASALTLSPNGSNTDTRIGGVSVPYAFHRARITAISGTGAAVTVTAVEA